jgi:beta-lactamase superfamily II metal-dependent hydrolase
MTGDVQRAGIAGLEAAGVDPSATVVEVPHHGSAEPAAMRFVERSGAAVALQSTGPARLDDDRWDGVRAGRRWLVTARHGAVWAWIRERGAVETGVTLD